jgi:hypothetical protein
MQNLSNLDLSELICLSNRIENEIKQFCHVSEHLPKSLVNSLNVYKEKLLKELDKRENY